jgi:hypothetical protein
MENRLTKALGLGDIDSVSEYERITEAILTDNLLFKRVVELLVAERGADAIAGMHRLEIEAFQKRVGFIRKNPTLRIEWAWLPAAATARGQVAMVRLRRYFGDAKVHEEQAFIEPRKDWTVAQFSMLSWYNSRPPEAVVAAFAAWLTEVSPEILAEERQQAAWAAEAEQKKQGQLSGDLATAVYTQKVAEEAHRG